MPLPDTVELPAGFDAHVHLRDGDMCKVFRSAANIQTLEHTNRLILPDRCPDGPPGWSEPGKPHTHTPDTEMAPSLTLSLALIMPNLAPTPVTTVKMALDYSARIKQALGKDEVDLLMTLYLHPDVTPETVREAKKAGVAAVKRLVTFSRIASPSSHFSHPRPVIPPASLPTAPPASWTMTPSTRSSRPWRRSISFCVSTESVRLMPAATSPLSTPSQR